MGCCVSSEVAEQSVEQGFSYVRRYASQALADTRGGGSALLYPQSSHLAPLVRAAGVGHVPFLSRARQWGAPCEELLANREGGASGLDGRSVRDASFEGDSSRRQRRPHHRSCNSRRKRGMRRDQHSYSGGPEAPLLSPGDIVELFVLCPPSVAIAKLRPIEEAVKVGLTAALPLHSRDDKDGGTAEVGKDRGASNALPHSAQPHASAGRADGTAETGDEDDGEWTPREQPSSPHARLPSVDASASNGGAAMNNGGASNGAHASGSSPTAPDTEMEGRSQPFPVAAGLYGTARFFSTSELDEGRRVAAASEKEEEEGGNAHHLQQQHRQNVPFSTFTAPGATAMGGGGGGGLGVLGDSSFSPRIPMIRPHEAPPLHFGGGGGHADAVPEDFATGNTKADSNGIITAANTQEGERRRRSHPLSGPAVAALFAADATMGSDTAFRLSSSPPSPPGGPSTVALLRPQHYSDVVSCVERSVIRTSATAVGEGAKGSFGSAGGAGDDGIGDEEAARFSPYPHGFLDVCTPRQLLLSLVSDPSLPAGASLDAASLAPCGSQQSFGQQQQQPLAVETAEPAVLGMLDAIVSSSAQFPTSSVMGRALAMEQSEQQRRYNSTSSTVYNHQQSSNNKEGESNPSASDALALASAVSTMMAHLTPQLGAFVGEAASALPLLQQHMLHQRQLHARMRLIRKAVAISHVEAFHAANGQQRRGGRGGEAKVGGGGKKGTNNKAAGTNEAVVPSVLGGHMAAVVAQQQHLQRMLLESIAHPLIATRLSHGPFVLDYVTGGESVAVLEGPEALRPSNTFHEANTNRNAAAAAHSSVIVGANTKDNVLRLTSSAAERFEESLGAVWQRGYVRYEAPRPNPAHVGVVVTTASFASMREAHRRRHITTVHPATLARALALHYHRSTVAAASSSSPPQQQLLGFLADYPLCMLPVSLANSALKDGGIAWKGGGASSGGQQQSANQQQPNGGGGVVGGGGLGGMAAGGGVSGLGGGGGQQHIAGIATGGAIGPDGQPLLPPGIVRGGRGEPPFVTVDGTPVATRPRLGVHCCGPHHRIRSLSPPQGDACGAPRRWG